MINKGIWIDKEKAHVIGVTGDRVEMQTVTSERFISKVHKEESHGASEILKDRKVLERQKLKNKEFFNAVLSILDSTKNLIILGPSLMGKRFAKTLKKDHKELSDKIRKVIVSDKMTDNQLKAFVKDFYAKKI